MRKAPVVPSDLLASVYEAAACSERWPAVIEQVTSWAGGIAGVFQARQLAPSLKSYAVMTGVDPDWQGKTFRFENDRFGDDPTRCVSNLGVPVTKVPSGSPEAREG